MLICYNISLVAHKSHLSGCLMAFCPKILGGGGTYKSLFCSKMNAASVVVTCEVVGTLNHYKLLKKIFLNFVHLEVVGT